MDLDHIDRRLERIESKLDDHLERVTRSEEAIDSMRGQIKWLLSGLIAVLSTAISATIKYLISGGK